MINPKPRKWTALQSLKTVSVQLKVQLYWEQPIWWNKEIKGTMINFIIFFINPLHRTESKGTKHDFGICDCNMQFFNVFY